MISSLQRLATLVTALCVGLMLLCDCGQCVAQPASVPSHPSATDKSAGHPPTLFIAGDSTASNGVPQAIGWGRMFGDYFSVPVVNLARGGASSRTYFHGENYQKLLRQLKQGDYVLIQFGHNDGGAINGPRVARGSLPGIGDDSKDIENVITEQPETVHTYGWYLRRMIEDVRQRKANPILLSLTVRNIWKDGKVERGSGNYRKWCRQVAEDQRVPFVDLTRLIADHYETLGQEKVADFFPKDHTHTGIEGARFNAEQVVIGLKGLREQALNQTLSPSGRRLPKADPENVVTFSPKHDRNNPQQRYRWLNLGVPADVSLPNIVLLGDSTVRNGRGDGSNRQFGWGDPFESYFDSDKVNVVNRAIGGLGARTFRDTRNYQDVLKMLKPGDVVLIQFGHNDNGPTGPIRGTGDETEMRPIRGSDQQELTHTFGWYLRQYIEEVQQTGATVVVCSLVPRNIWKDGKIARSADGHAAWARTIAESSNVGFIDLHEIIAKQYDSLGQDEVNKLFADVRVHTNWDGAVINAAAVMEGLQSLEKNPVAQYLRWSFGRRSKNR